MIDIRAEAHSDDRVFKARFDAGPWFAQAPDEEILALKECDFGGDYAADVVAQFAADSNEDVQDIFDYLALKNKHEAMGFECHVNEEDALLWLAEQPGKSHLVEAFLSGGQA